VYSAIFSYSQGDLTVFKTKNKIKLFCYEKILRLFYPFDVIGNLLKYIKSSLKHFKTNLKIEIKLKLLFSNSAVPNSVMDSTGNENKSKTLVTII
jgi:hypothetical protein